MILREHTAAKMNCKGHLRPAPKPVVPSYKSPMQEACRMMGAGMFLQECHTKESLATDVLAFRKVWSIRSLSQREFCVVKINQK